MATIFFWIIVLISVLFCGWWGFRPNGDRSAAGVPFLALVLIILLGLKVFPFQW